MSGYSPVRDVLVLSRGADFVHTYRKHPDDPVFPTIARNMVRYLRLGIGEGWLPIADRRNSDGVIKNEPVKGSRPVTGSNRNADNGGQANG